MFSASREPRIAMVGDRRDAGFGAWRDVDLSYVWTHYVDAITGAGGAPVVFPIAECYSEDPALALDCVDGLLLTGGRDLDAHTYGRQPGPHNDPGDPRRDRVEAEVARAGLARGLPVLGICRGMQLLNVVLGGGVDQHIADPEHLHLGEPGRFVDHPIAVEPGTRLASILGEHPAPVRSHHHQALDRLAPELVVGARALDGLIEAVESPDRSFCLAVLWHPEENLEAGGLRLYEALVSAARSHAGVVL